MKKIAVIAHDGQKEEILKFVSDHRCFFVSYPLIATGHTGAMLKEKGFEVECVPPGPEGGDVLIGAKVVTQEILAVFFFRNHRCAHPHEHDIGSILRMCDMYNVPVATNQATAELLAAGLGRQNTCDD